MEPVTLSGGHTVAGPNVVHTPPLEAEKVTDRHGHWIELRPSETDRQAIVRELVHGFGRLGLIHPGANLEHPATLAELANHPAIVTALRWRISPANADDLGVTLDLLSTTNEGES